MKEKLLMCVIPALVGLGILFSMDSMGYQAGEEVAGGIDANTLKGVLAIIGTVTAALGQGPVKDWLTALFGNKDNQLLVDMAADIKAIKNKVQA